MSRSGIPQSQSNGAPSELKNDLVVPPVIAPPDNESTVLRYQISKSRKFIEHRRHYLDWAKKEIEELKKQSAEEDKKCTDSSWRDLRSAINAAPAASEADPSTLLESVNDRVEQLALYAASNLEHHFLRRDVPTVDQQPLVDILPVLGHYLHEKLLKSPAGGCGDSKPLQYALQAVITYVMHRVLSRFSVASNAFMRSDMVDAAFSQMANVALGEGTYCIYA